MTVQTWQLISDNQSRIFCCSPTAQSKPKVAKLVDVKFCIYMSSSQPGSKPVEKVHVIYSKRKHSTMRHILQQYPVARDHDPREKNGC